MGKKDNSVKESQWSPIIIAIIGAVAVIIVGYWQYYSPKPDIVGTNEFVGRVIEIKTEKRIRNAKVSLEVQGAPLIIYTDSEGIFSFPLKNTDNPVRVRVEAAGYEKFDRLITPSSKIRIEEIQLEPISPSPPDIKVVAKQKLAQQIENLKSLLSSGRVSEGKTGGRSGTTNDTYESWTNEITVQIEGESSGVIKIYYSGTIRHKHYIFGTETETKDLAVSGMVFSKYSISETGVVTISEIDFQPPQQRLVGEIARTLLNKANSAQL